MNKYPHKYIFHSPLRKHCTSHISIATMASSTPLRQISETFIKPKYNSNKTVELTQWDISMLSVHHSQKGLLFPKPLIPMETLLEKLKDSLSIALVHFYSLAGQLETQVDEQNHTSFIYINCNKGPGARFLHSSLELTVSDISSSEAASSLFSRNLVINYDGHTLPLLTVQVIELIDGVFLACSVNHACIDGTSFWHFLNSWSEIFMANPISRPPVYDRWFLDGIGPIKLPYTRPEEFVGRFKMPPYRSKIFHFSAGSIAKLKSKANSDCGSTNKISSFQSMAAFVWRCITRARCVPDDQYTNCTLLINDRGRLLPPLSTDYFGNSVSSATVKAKAGELVDRSLGWAALLLNEAVVSRDDKKVRDDVERWMKDPRVIQIGSDLDPYRVNFAGSSRFDVYGPEFGMGKALGVYEGGGNKYDGKVRSAPGREEKGSVDLLICLSAHSLNALQMDPEFAEACFFV